MLLSTRTTVSFALFLPQSDWLEWATLRMRNIVCFHVSRSCCCCCCGRLINKLDPLHTYNLTWSCCLECDKFGLMILSLLLLATPPTHTHRHTHRLFMRRRLAKEKHCLWPGAFHLIFILIRRHSLVFILILIFISILFLAFACPLERETTHTHARTHVSGAQRCQLFEKAMLKYQKALENK